MIRIQYIAIGLTGVLAGLAGCSEWQQFNKTAQEHNPQAVAKAPDAVNPAPAELDTDATATDDLHKPETDAQVLEFVERLNAVSRIDNTPPTADPPPHSQNLATPPASTAMAANSGADILATPLPSAQSADERPAMQPPVIESVFVRGAGLVDSDDPPTQTTGTANEPLSSDPPEHSLSLEEMVALLTEQVTKTPGDLQAQWQLTLLQMANGDDDAARNLPVEFADDTAAILRELIETMIATRDVLDDPVTGMDAALDKVDTLRASLAEQADLRIPTVALCSRVKTFGVFDVLPPGALLPHQANRAIVYLEVGNFLSEPTADDQYRTVLNQELEVLTASGQQVWHRAQPQIVDLCRTKRRDFFLAQLITLPATLGAGQYVLKVTLEDALSGRTTQAIHPFQIGNAAVVEAGP